MSIIATIGTAIFSNTAGVIVSNVFDRATELYQSYLNKEISEEQYAAEKVKFIEEANALLYQAYADAAARVYEAAQETLRASFVAPSWFTRNAWAFVVFSQTLVLLWYQVGIPFYVKYFGGSFPRTGDDLLMWAYALVAAALGAGVIQQFKGRSLK